MILITGGIKSGKSTLALKLARKFTAPRVFIATSVAFDSEMSQKIERHKSERGKGFTLIEEPTDIHKILRSIKAKITVIDCMTTWVSNLIYYEKDMDAYFKNLMGSLKGSEIIVTNEAGMGVIPANKISRHYLNRLGELNKMLAKRADKVYLMVSGLKVKIK